MDKFTKILKNITRRPIDSDVNVDDDDDVNLDEDETHKENKIFLNKPKPFTPNKEQNGKDWQIWKNEFLTYLKLTEINSKFTKEERAYILVNLMGTEAIKAMQEMSFNDENDKKDMNVLLAKFDEIFILPINELEERYKFFSREKIHYESIDDYVEDLKEKASRCNFGDQADKFIVDMIILNAEKHLQQILIQQDDVSLSEIILLYKQYTSNDQKIKEASENNTNSGENSNIDRNEQVHAKFVCWRCGSNHPLKCCPAWGKFCDVCNDMHHMPGRCCVPKYPCSKCDVNHPSMQCPASGKHCFNCLERGHFASRCINRKEIVESTAKPEYCFWCDLKHLPEQCPHDITCPMCNDYPHNICFHCRKNPHIDTCIFNDSIVLPVGKEIKDQKAYQLKNCLWCGTMHHPQGLCPHDATCPSCSNFPHNICFQCRGNPHVESCIFKDFLTLPDILHDNLEYEVI